MSFTNIVIHMLFTSNRNSLVERELDDKITPMGWARQKF